MPTKHRFYYMYMERTVAPPANIPHPGCRVGFTLIELLVSISIIALLIGMTIPAIQMSREGARRMHCASNLRQMATAMSCYYANANMFPSSQLKTGANWTSNCMSEATFLLPYMEQSVIYNMINMTYVQIDSPESPLLVNRTARRSTLNVFLCPSDKSADGRNSYRFNRGRFGPWATGSPFDGPFSVGILPSQATVTDGLANTAFVSERVMGSFSETEGDRVRDIKHPLNYGDSIIRMDSEYIPFCLQSSPEGWVRESGRYWMYSGFAFTHYNHNGRPNDSRPSCGIGITRDIGFGLHPPRSYHSGGVNLMFGDGHIGFIAESIDPEIWTGLGTHDGGEVVEPPG